MKDCPAPVAILLIICAGIGIGCTWALSDKVADMRQKAVEHGAANYDSSGRFTWNE